MSITRGPGRPSQKVRAKLGKVTEFRRITPSQVDIYENAVLTKRVHKIDQRWFEITIETKAVREVKPPPKWVMGQGEPA
jgi:hypothetical protein